MIRVLKISTLTILLVLLTSLTTVWGQDDYSLLQMAVPSLNIAPDARGGGMGDLGVA